MSYLGNLKGWPEKPLIEVSTLKRGYDLPVSSRKNGDVPIYAANGINGSHNEIKAKGPGVITGRSGTIGKVHFTEDGFWPLNTALYVTNFKGNHPRWVYYMLRAFHLERFVQGAGVPTLNRNLVHGELVPVPPISEQKRIASILDKADAIRRKRTQAIQLADKFLHSVFLDMFGDPVTNPKGWEIRTLKDISSKIHSGSTPQGGSKVYVEKGTLFLRSQNVWKNKLVLDDVAYIDEATHIKMSKSSLKNKDILITKTGRFNTENSSLGRAAMYLGEDGGANVNGHVYLVRLHKDVVKEFVLHILTTNEYREYIRRVCVGGIDKRQINKEHLEKFSIISPPLEKQEQFARLLQFLAVQKSKAEKSLISAERLFNSLNQQAFRGGL